MDRIPFDRTEVYEALVEALDGLADKKGVIQGDPKTVAELCVEALGFGTGPYDA